MKKDLKKLFRLKRGIFSIMKRKPQKKMLVRRCLVIAFFFINFTSSFISIMSVSSNLVLITLNTPF